MKAPLTFIAVVVSFGVASVGAIAPAAAQESAPGVQQFSYVVHQVSRSDLQGHNSTTTSFGVLKPGATAAIPQSGFTSHAVVSANSLGSTTECEVDSAYLVEGCTHINWDRISCGGVHCYNVPSTSVTYYREDPGASGIQARYVEGIAGKWYQGCGGTSYYSGTHSFGWHTITSGTTYTYTGYWSGKYTLVYAAASESRGGVNYMDWYFRTHHYAFSFQTLLVD
ncbi:MAG: hypothetical protein QOK11_54 [Pseudonocardiales bacterium]|nr:hypothetical protein [Pseudonocardiales bacterium]